MYQRPITVNHPNERKRTKNRIDRSSQIKAHSLHIALPFHNRPPIPLTTPFTPLTIVVHTHPVCKLPLTIPKPTRAAQLSTNTTLKEPQNCPRVYSACCKGTLKYAMTRLAGRNKMVNLVRSRVMRVRCSTSRDSLRVKREKFWEIR